MSMGYRVSLKNLVREVVKGGDEICHRLDLQEVLAEEEMKEILRAALQERGFEEGEGDQLSRKGDDGVITEVDLEEMTITNRLEVQQELSAQVEETGRGTSQEHARRDAQTRLSQRRDALIEAGSRDVQREATRKLEQGEEARVEEINEILQGVYAEALKRKAPRMGDVVEVRESTSEAGDYELVIKVQV